jgi:hypothetical protein
MLGSLVAQDKSVRKPPRSGEFEPGADGQLITGRTPSGEDDQPGVDGAYCR